MFYGFEDFLNYTLYFPELEVEDGFAMIGGTPLPAAIREAATDSELTLFKVLKKVSLEIFDALYILHSHGWFHGDIRPYNIVLDENGDAKLIDFVTADVFGDNKRFYFSQGHFDNFFSTQLIQINNQDHVYLPRWEYESLVYSILFCALSLSSINDAFGSIESRQIFLENSQYSPKSILRFCWKFFSLVQGLEDRRPGEEFRTTVISELGSFEFSPSTPEE